MSRIIHFEIPASNPEKSISFYKNVFNWEFSKWGGEQYWLAKTGDDEKPGINGAVMKRKDPEQPMVNTVEVTDLEATAKVIEKHGGEIVVPKMPIPSVGWLIYCKDPDGVIIGAMQPDEKAK